MYYSHIFDSKEFFETEKVLDTLPQSVKEEFNFLFEFYRTNLPQLKIDLEDESIEDLVEDIRDLKEELAEEKSYVQELIKALNNNSIDVPNR
jgi:hypothetical protein